MVLMVSAKVTGAADLARKFEARANRSSVAQRVALEEAGTIVAAEAQRLIMDGPKTGRIYKKYVPRRTHQASAPNEAPANDLGHLVAGIVQDKAQLAQGRIRIASLAKYSKPLEFGTRHMAPRPYLRRALQSSRKDVLRAFRLAYARLG